MTLSRIVQLAEEAGAQDKAATPGPWLWSSNGTEPQLEGSVEYPEMNPVLVAHGCGNKEKSAFGVEGCMPDKLLDPLRSCPLHPRRVDRDFIMAARISLPVLARFALKAAAVVERAASNPCEDFEVGRCKDVDQSIEANRDWCAPCQARALIAETEVSR